jgi:hypothetical protein
MQCSRRSACPGVVQWKPQPEPRAWRAATRGAVAHPADGPPQSRARLATADAAPWPHPLLQGGQLDHGSVALASGRPSRPAGGHPEKRQNERCGGHGLAMEVHLRLSPLIRKECCNWRLTCQGESNVDADEDFSTSRPLSLHVITARCQSMVTAAGQGVHSQPTGSAVRLSP